MNTEQLGLRRMLWGLVKVPSFSREFVVRVGLVVLFVTITELLPWYRLRFFTSEAVLRASAWFGMATARVSFDTIRVQQGLFRFVVPCTFVDVVAGSIPLLWYLEKSLGKNLLRLLAAASILLVFNFIRLEAGHILYSRGVPWVIADSVLGGVSYFLVWQAIWRQRSWHVFASGADESISQE